MTRLGFGLLTITFGLALGCNDEQPAPPPELIPTVHPGGKLLSPALPANFGSGRTASSDASAFDQVTAVLSEHDQFARVTRLTELLQQLGPEALDDIRLLLKMQFHHHMGGAEMVLLARFWALHEPEEATNWAMNLSPPGYRLSLTLPTMQMWASKDPLAAANYVAPSSVLSAPDMSAAERALVAGWFQSGVPGLEQYILSLGMGNARQRALRVLTRLTIEEYGPDVAINWAVSLPEDDKKFKLAAYRQLGKELSVTHPESAVQFCNLYCNSEFGDSVRRLIAQGWAGRDGVAAMAWVKDNYEATPAVEKKMVVKSAFRGFQRVDKPACYAWMESLGTDGIEAWLQPALEMYSVHIGQGDPQRGVVWADAIVNDKDRVRVLITIAIRWHKKNPAEANAWMASSELSEAERERVRLYGQRGTPSEVQSQIRAAGAENAEPEAASQTEEPTAM